MQHVLSTPQNCQTPMGSVILWNKQNMTLLDAALRLVFYMLVRIWNKHRKDPIRLSARDFTVLCQPEDNSMVLS